MALSALFGSELLTKDGRGSTEALLAGKTIGVYFSAHWCPPCRGFTPKLAEMYEKTFKAKGLEIVFVSSDKDEAAFKEYFGEMPWLALPYDQRELKESLSKKYKVRGIPSFVILDAEGNTITTDGRSEIMSDPEGARFPWKPLTREEQGKAVLEILGDDLVAKAGGKPMALYFSAHWCPPCRGFTPQLAKWYNEGLKDKMEIIFVSSDRDEASFNEYFAEMPWQCLPFANRSGKDKLSKICGVEGIPHLAVLGADGQVITTDGRAAVTRDPSGASFPEGWRPQPIGDVSEDVDALNSEKCLVLLGATESAELKEVALEYYEKAGKEVSEMAYRFFTAGDNGITEQLRKLTGIKAPESKLLLLDLDDSGAFYTMDSAVSSGSIRAFLRDFEGKTLERKQLSK